MSERKKLLRSLDGETQSTPPVWMMRQAGRYLPEYRATRAKAGDFLSLCYNSHLAAEVTLQPIKRYGFDAAILFADILLVPQALGANLWFVTGEGPRLEPITTRQDFKTLLDADDIHERLAPVYETVRILARELPRETTLIGFAGAPWTVATYMIAGRGTPDQAPAHKLKDTNRHLFIDLMDRITGATITYLSRQIEAGAEVVKLFDSWAGSLKDDDFREFSLAPTRTIVSALKELHPEVPIIVFPRQAGSNYIGYAAETGADCVALDTSVDATWAAQFIQSDGCVQGNLDPQLLIKGGSELVSEVRRIREAFSAGPHIFNLGHGITPEADPDNVALMVETLREKST